ncbi:hypothetical protein JRO89_XS15G0037200 [Xanthoceras sorbifolium]|uniref:Uncharacterized protein n=1 Tax=Xanthoceras sorbifolium TaxID=99658 RepID=A0ABQ8H0Y6_9ROSI|nr:hypothetical protein JRO89_XS15G0037200 [Xanthoceras sorbifolium]
MSQFDGTKETKPALERPMGEDVIKELEELRLATHEKNVFDNLIGTMMNIDGKTKGSLNAYLDLQEWGIRQELHPIESIGKIVLPSARYSLSIDKKKIVCKWLVDLKVPNGNSSNISHCVNASDTSISGLRTHDCHVFWERLLPLIVRELLPKQIDDAVIELFEFFKNICAKVLREED